MTGGVRGIGSGIVRGFAQAGASNIAMIDIRDELGAEAVESLSKEFPSTKFKYYHLDISNYDEVYNINRVEESETKLILLNSSQRK